MEAFLSSSFFQMYYDWLIFAICAVLGFFLKGTFISIIKKWLGIFNFFKKEKFIPFQTPLTYIALFSFYLFCIYSIQPKGSSLVISIVQVSLSISFVFFIRPALHLIVDGLQYKFQKDKDPLYNQFFKLSKKTLSVILFLLGGLIIIQNLGYNVTSLVAGLGIGGVAVALAAKDTISNIFGSIIILFDRPFIVGDWIQFENTEGTVEYIGFRSTQIKTFYDSVISIPNAILANTKIDNLGKRKARRTRFNLGLVYSTPPEKITAFIEGIKQIIHAHPKTKKDYFQVSFSGYGDSSLNIFINVFFHVANWNEELEAKQNIFLEILKLAKKIEVEFAFPSQSLYIENMTSSVSS